MHKTHAEISNVLMGIINVQLINSYRKKCQLIIIKLWCVLLLDRLKKLLIYNLLNSLLVSNPCNYTCNLNYINNLRV